jgi:hypothetical protein
LATFAVNIIGKYRAHVRINGFPTYMKMNLGPMNGLAAIMNETSAIMNAISAMMNAISAIMNAIPAYMETDLAAMDALAA